MMLLGAAWLIARSLDFAVNGSIEKIKNRKKGTPGVGSEKNRYRIAAGRNQSDHISGVSEESPITDVVDPHDPEEVLGGIQPSKPWPTDSATDFGNDLRNVPMTEMEIRKTDIVHEIGLLKDLEKKHWENICDLDERTEALESLTAVIGNHGKEIEELNGKLRDAIFVLYQGPKPFPDLLAPGKDIHPHTATGGCGLPTVKKEGDS